MFIAPILKSLATLIVLALAAGCATAPAPTDQDEELHKESSLQSEEWQNADLNQEWLEDLFIQAKEFLENENHKALYQSKIVREDFSSSTANQLSLAYHFRTGKSFGTYDVEQDTDKALHWYKLAAEAGDAIAHFNVACLTYRSRQAFSDIPEPYRSAGAMKSMRLAAGQGLLFAQLDLSSYYRYGVGTGVSFEWSDYWLKEAEKTLAQGYQNSIRPPKPADPLLLQTPPPSGQWEFLYLAPDQARDWLSFVKPELETTDSSKSSHDTILAAYLKAGYCSPQDSREARLLRLR